LDYRESKGIPKEICFIDYTKAFVWITVNWKTLPEIGTPDHLTYVLRSDKRLNSKKKVSQQPSYSPGIRKPLLPPQGSQKSPQGQSMVSETREPFPPGGSKSPSL